MKVCSNCGREYADDMFFCLEDGTFLQSNTEKNVSPGGKSGRATNESNHETYIYPAGGNLPPSQQKTVNLPARKSHLGIIIASVIIGVSILSGVFIYGLISRIPARQNRGFETAEASPTVAGIKPLFPAKTPEYTSNLKIEIGERVKAGFNENFIKCLVTNTGEQIIKSPSVSLVLYKNDLKVGSISESSKLKYLKPNQTIPIWVSLGANKEYTAARIDEERKYSVAEKEPDLLYPNVIYTDAKMTSEIGTSLLNFRPYREVFYSVKGTIENRQYDILKTEIFIIFYDDKSEIVGITSTTPPDLKRNEKAEFEASMGDKKLFGTPAKFELIAIDESRTN